MNECAHWIFEYKVEWLTDKLRRPLHHIRL